MKTYYISYMLDGDDFGEGEIIHRPSEYTDIIDFGKIIKPTKKKKRKAWEPFIAALPKRSEL